MNQLNKQKSVKSIGQIVLLLSFVCVLATYVPYLISIPRGDEEWEYYLPFAFALFGILPAGTIFCLNEYILKKIFSFQRTRLANQQAGIYGLIVGATLVFITLLFYKVVYSGAFLGDIFPPKNERWYLGNFELRINPFLIPIIFNVISSPYMGWKINKTKSIESTLVTKE